MIIKAQLEDLPKIMVIIEHVILEMKSYGNKQWNEQYPTSEDFKRDITSGDLYVQKEGDIIQGFVCLNYVDSAEYSYLNWGYKEKSLFIHRMAINPDFRGLGLAKKMIEFAESLAIKNNVYCIKTDTNSKNDKMNSLFKTMGFNFIGGINLRYIEAPFYYYEKLLDCTNI